MQTLPNLLLPPCFPRYKSDVSLTEEAEIGLVLTVQLRRIVWNAQHLQLSMPKEWLLEEMREQTQKEQLMCILT